MRLPPLAGAVLSIAAVLGAALLRGPDADPSALAPKSPGLVLEAAHPRTGDSRFVVHQELDELATLFAMRPYSIHCPTPEAWAEDPLAEIAWGYTMLGWDYAVLDPVLCEAALAIGTERPSEDWARALAVAVLVHESYHGRRWGARANEAKVECKAIRHWRVAAVMLGADDDELARLWPWALSLHWRLVRLADDYYLPTCDVPNPW